MSASERLVVVDLDGVVWLAGEPLPGVGEAVSRLRSSGFDVLFATNNSAPSIAELLARLERAGIDTEPGAVITAAQAAVSSVRRGSSALVVGDAGLREAVEARGLKEGPRPSVVLVGWQRSFDFETIARAATAVRSGARLIATNDDPTHPTPDGLLPGTGALVAAIATAAEQQPEIAGKPGAAMVSLVTTRGQEVALVIGDRPSTDGAFASRLDAPFGLVRSEATPAELARPAFQGEGLLEVVEVFLSEEHR